MSQYYILGLLVLLATLWAACAQPGPTITPTSRATTTPVLETTATLPPKSAPTPTAPPMSSRIPFEVITSSLDNPRGLAFGPEGALYIVEAGRGGDESCIEGPGGFSHCYGLTGAVTRVWQGVQERIATGLPSLSSREGAITYGPHDISFNDRGDGFLIVGFAAHPDVRKQLGEGGAVFGRLLHISSDGQLRSVGDPAAHEALANPDGAHIESNPYAILARSGEYIIVDAAGNSLLRMDSDGNVATLAAFPTRSVEAPASFNLPSGAKFPIQSVPTSVTLGPDGAYYVSELTGGPYPPGEARIYRIVSGQEPQVFAEGFTNVIDIAFDGDGSLLVLEIATNSLASPNPTGALIRLNPKTGERETLAREGLRMPTGVAIGPDGAVYISNCGVCVGEGQVIRIDLSGSPEGSSDGYIEGVGEQQEIMPTRDHVPEGQSVEYSTTPPTSGDHWGIWAECGFYDYTIPDERVVHNLEHGNIVINYNLTSNEEVQHLRDVIDDISLSNIWGVTRFYDEIPEGTVVLTAWGVLDAMSGIDEERIKTFFEYAGNLGPERVPCK